MTKKDHPELKRFTLPLSYEMWAEFKKISVQYDKSMTEMVREIIEKIINKYGENKVEKKQEMR